MKQVNGTISIGRLFGGGEEKEVRIEIVDETSRVHFLDARMSVEGFARALFSESSIPIKITLRGLDVIGMRHENKEEFVPFTGKWISNKEEREKRIAEALAPFEVDGWRARADDMQNNHRYRKQKDGTEGFEVVFHRHVPNV